MRKHKLFAMLIAVLGVNSLTAQTDVTSTYLTNADFEDTYSEFWKGNQRAIFQPKGWNVVRTNGDENDMSILTATDVASNNFSGWTINDETTRGKQTYWARLRWGGQVWKSSGTTGKPTDIQLSQVVKLPSGVYRLSADLLNYAGDGKEKNNHTYLKAISTNNNWSVEPTISYKKGDTNWENKSLLITSSGETEYTIMLQCLQNWQVECISGFDNVKLEEYTVTSEEPIDITTIVPVGTANWTNNEANNAGSFVSGDVTMVERYYKQHYIGTVSELFVKDLPLGKYEAEIYCQAHCADWDCTAIAEAAGQTDRTILSANNVEYGIPIVNDRNLSEGPQVRKLTDIKVTDGTLNFKVRNDKEGANWLTFEIKSLKYLGPDLSIYQEALVEALENAKSIDMSSIPASFATRLENAISAGENVEQTPEAIQAATTELLAAIQAAKEVHPSYNNVLILLSICEDILNNSEEFEAGAKETFASVVNVYREKIRDTTTKDEINNVFDELETAREAYVVKADPTNGISFDYTFFVTNPGFDKDKDGWTSTGGAQNKAIATNKTNGIITGKFYENWNSSAFTGEIYQTVSNLPSGIYKLKIAAFGDGTNVYANDLQTAVTTSEGAWYEVDQVKVGDGTLKFGIKNENANTWMGIDNVSLYYNGFDVETAQNRVTNLKEEAKNLLTPPMGTSEAAELNAAIAAADASKSTRKDLSPMIDALETAIGKANEWTRLYNEAKAPLLALLEMFESKYNDGENGCLYTVDEDSWNALIVAVTAANTAKDVNNDYSGFAAATESLKAAFVPVDASIMAYPTVNKKSATASDMTNYYLVNASFDEENTNGWVKTGSQTNNVAWSVTDGTFKATPSGSHYTGDAIWQKVTLPKGAYKLSVNVNADEVEGHSSYLFASTSAPVWNNTINDLLASAVVENYNEDVTLTCIFSLSEETIVYVGFNQTAGNRANTGIQGSYTIYDFTLTQAANQISTKDGVITVVGENEAADLAGISSDENIVKVDLTGAIWSEASTLDINNKNSLVYVTDDANLTASNIVKVGVDEEGNTTRVAESIVLTEGYKFVAREAFTATTLNYARGFSANWLTVCLPFAYAIPENVKVETLGAVDLDAKTFTFNEVTGTMEANKPYIIKNSSETAALFAELGDVAVEATPEAMTIKVTADNSEYEAEFIGTYTAVKTDALMEDGVYDILFFGTDGQLYYLSQGTTEKVVNIKPFRAYIRLPKGAINWSDGQQAIARHGEGTTDIEDAELTNEGAPAIYDLMGRKVTSMEKDGMYIVNGKKVIVK